MEKSDCLSQPPSVGLTRRQFCVGAGATLGVMLVPGAVEAVQAVSTVNDGVRIVPLRKHEDIFSHIRRLKGSFDRTLYRRIIGAANDFKEGDRIVGVAATDETSRKRARQLLLNSRAGDLAAHPLFDDPLYDVIKLVLDPAASARIAVMTLRELRDFILSHNESEIRPLLDGLSADLAGCLVKLMDNNQLIAVGRKLFNPLPGSMIGASGYMGARIQPNSPTDNPDDIFWQVLSGFSYGVGDVVLGTNPVSSEPDSVAAIENCLLDIRRTFGIEEIIPHCVLAHITIQARVEKQQPGSTGIWFQSIAGSTAVNKVFDLSLEQMLAFAAERTGRYGFYFETGQGADFTNGHSHGTDMVIHEARKYGFARFLKQKVAEAQQRAGHKPAPWVHVNDVAGFIGPEVFRSKEQLVRCCLEDSVMAKLQGVTIGLDVCTTLHMDISLDDLDWCLDQIMPCNPGYLMALPTKMDPMLGYMTTSFQDHVRLRERFGFKVNDAIWRFFQRLGVICDQGKPGTHFGQPLQVWLQYRKAKGDLRPDNEILEEGRIKMEQVRKRGVPLAEGYGEHPCDLPVLLDQEIRAVYADAKRCIRKELPGDFANWFPKAITLSTTSKNRDDYILHPQTGEQLDGTSLRLLRKFRKQQAKSGQVQLVVSDGLNVYSLTDKGNLLPYLDALRSQLVSAGVTVAPEMLVVRNGRVRVGYRIGELLFSELPDSDTHRAVVHIIGERPGSMHHTFSAYITAPVIKTWNRQGLIDHTITRVVSGIAADALSPSKAAALTVKIVKELMVEPKNRNNRGDHGDSGY